MEASAPAPGLYRNGGLQLSSYSREGTDMRDGEREATGLDSILTRHGGGRRRMEGAPLSWGLHQVPGKKNDAFIQAGNQRKEAQVRGKGCCCIPEFAWMAEERHGVDGWWIPKDRRGVDDWWIPTDRRGVDGWQIPTDRCGVDDWYIPMDRHGVHT